MNPEIFSFKVTLRAGLENDYSNETISRVIHIPNELPIAALAESITNAFGFTMDNCFGFFSETTGDIWESKEKYEIFADLDIEELKGELNGSLSCIDNSIATAFKPNKTMLFLFDYIECWEFVVECIGQEQEDAEREYPYVTEIVGVAPERISVDCDEDEEYEFEDEDEEEDEEGGCCAEDECENEIAPAHCCEHDEEE